MRFKVEIYPEICCDDCNGVIYNHFDCPVCKKIYAGTDAYGEILPDEDINTFIECENCNSKFKILSINWYKNTLKIELIEKNNRKNMTLKDYLEKLENIIDQRCRHDYGEVTDELVEEIKELIIEIYQSNNI
jgi:hypothetical protein